MSKLTSIGGLWHRVSSAFERADIDDAGAEHRDPRGDEEAVRPTATRYSPIREAVERRVNTFLRQDLVSHLEIGFNEIFLLHYIEIAADPQGVAALEHFLHEFSPEARVHWVKKLLGPAVGQHVSVEQFLGLDQEFTAEQLAETDPFEEQLNLVARPLYRVILHGRWETRAPAANPAAQTAGANPPPQASRTAGPCLRLSVSDARSTGPGGEGAPRAVDVDHYPAELGSSARADVGISGYYVSARHCTLHWEGGQLWLEDHSTNGTWVDGARVQRGARVALGSGAVLAFGRSRGDGDHQRYPEALAQWTREPPAAGAGFTPVAPSGSTPVAPPVGAPSPIHAAGGKAPLALLDIADATGSPKRDVLALPFTIGRGSAQDYVVPDANQGVSREHLVIEAIDRAGAMTLNRAVGRNGTFAGNQPLPERFVWRFGQEIVLGEKWTDAPVVKLSLRRVEPTN